jgi:hypothetical protein
MELSFKEVWAVLHGMGFGAVFLLAFAGGLAGLYSLRPELITPAGLVERVRRMQWGLWVMAIMAWATVISGTWIVYIWYRAKPPENADLVNYPRYFLLSKPHTAGWHTFAMEWKEHVAWIVPIVATSVAFIVSHYGRSLVAMPKLRKAAMWFLIIGFGCAAIAGAYGAFINKLGPIR